MILNELHGYKQYLDKDFYELMDLLKQHAYINTDGMFSTVVIPKTGDAVYKVWTNDEGYETFYDVARSMQNNVFVPKMSRIHRLPIFFKRPDKVDGFLKIVKLERLKPLSKAGIPDMALARGLCEYLSILISTKVSLSGFGKEHAAKDAEIFVSRMKSSSNFRQHDAAHLDKILESLQEHNADLYQLAAALRSRHINVAEDIDLDLHQENVMLRGHVPVIIDPFSHNQDYQAYQRGKGVLFMNHLDTNIEAINDAVQRGKFASASVKSGTRPHLKD